MQSINVDGKYGAIYHSGSDRSRNLYADVRVGNYDLDSSGEGGFEFGFYFGVGDGWGLAHRERWRWGESPLRGAGGGDHRGVATALNLFSIRSASP